MNLEDLSPDNELSLHPAKADFDAKEWVKQVNETKFELVIIEEKVKIAKEIEEEFFGEEEEPVETKKTTTRRTSNK